MKRLLPMGLLVAALTFALGRLAASIAPPRAAGREGTHATSQENRPPDQKAPPSPSPQGDQITGVVKGTTGSRVSVAVAPPTAGGNLSSTKELLATIRSDLDFSGYFDLVPEERARLVPPVPAGLPPPLREWLSVGADSVLSTRVSEDPRKLECEGRLFDTRSGEMIMGARYGGDPEYVRKVAHRISDDLVRRLTGQQGIASTWIAYVVKTSPATKEIYVMDYDGARPRRLARTGSLSLSPTWSADGEHLVYISFRGRQPGIELIDLAGRIRRAPTAGGDLNSAPDWSPDGKKLAYTSDRDGNSEIYVMDLESGAERRLTSNPAIDASPSWSPTGREIAFTSNRAGSPQIYIIDSDGLNARRLTHSGDYNDSAAWSPRGDKIAFVSRLNGHFEIFVHDIARDVPTQLTFTGRNNENPRWSPDGRHIVFASDRSGEYQIYTMDAGGSTVRLLTRGEPAFTPDWSHARY